MAWGLKQSEGAEVPCFACSRWELRDEWDACVPNGRRVPVLASKYTERSSSSIVNTFFYPKYATHKFHLCTVCAYLYDHDKIFSYSVAMKATQNASERGDFS